MKPATRDSLLRAGLVLAFGVAGALLVFAWQSGERVGELEAELAELGDRFAQSDAQQPTTEPATGRRGRSGQPQDELGQAIRNRIAERYVFSRKPQDRFRQVQGVLGNRVFFAGGQSSIVGETFDGVEILRIDAEGVVVSKDGEEITVQVSGASSRGGGSSRSFQRRRGARSR